MEKYVAYCGNGYGKRHLFDTRAEAVTYAEKKNKKARFQLHVSKVTVEDDGSLSFCQDYTFDFFTCDNHFGTVDASNLSEALLKFGYSGKYHYTKSFNGEIIQEGTCNN